MSDVFGIEGGPQGTDGNQGAAKPGAEQGEKTPAYRAGEGPQGRYMQYDNEMGAMLLNLIGAGATRSFALANSEWTPRARRAPAAGPLAPEAADSAR